jgi:hypothetical protein
MPENLLLRFRLRGDLIYVDAELMFSNYYPKRCGELFLKKFCTRIIFAISTTVMLVFIG